MTTATTATTTAPTTPATPEVPEGFRLVEFTFRLIKASAGKRFEDAKQAFDMHKVSYESLKDDAGAVTGIRRNPVTVPLPVYTVEEFMEANPEFVQTTLDGIVKEAAQGKFIDNYYSDVDPALLTLADVIEFASASRRASAVPEELLKAVNSFVVDTLTEQGRKPGTIAVISELIAGKFNKKVLAKYRAHENKFSDILATVERCYATEVNEEGEATACIPTFDVHYPALKVFYDNVTTYFAELEKMESSDELDLI